MQIPLSWLKEYVSLDGLTPQDLVTLLTDIGLEVEAVAEQAPFPSSVVVGRVLEAVPHPNADSLRVCRVDVGQKDPLKIVCGAPNAREGITVAVATIGTQLGPDFKIKAAKIRGESSEGMLCSAKELGLSEEHDGIIEMTTNAALGSPAATALGVGEVVLTLNVTPNRADCLSIIGVARDLAAKLKRPLRLPEVFELSSQSEASVMPTVASEELCTRFVVAKVANVTAGASPNWLKKRVESVGLRSINTIVDVTNFVMMEMGQPIHAYDIRDVKGGILGVRAGGQGEKMATLDGKEQAIEETDILIIDAERAVGLAGIMGGQNSEVKDTTTEVLIEVASFAAPRIRRTSKRLAIHTDASHRFERGIDESQLMRVASRVVDLLKKCCADAVVKAVADWYPSPLRERRVALRPSRLKKIMGFTTLKTEEIKERLEALGIRELDHTDDRMLMAIPTWRADIEKEIDLIEEVGRMVGFDKVLYLLPEMNIRPTPEAPAIATLDQIKVALADMAYTEVVSFPFHSPTMRKSLRIADDHPLNPLVRLRNPLAEQESVLQTSLIYSLTQALLRNRNQLTQGARLFECGRGYFRKNGAQWAGPFWSLAGAEKPATVDALGCMHPVPVIERDFIAGIIDQPWSGQTWNNAETAAEFFHAKATVAQLFKHLGCGELIAQRPDQTEFPFIHNGRAATFWSGDTCVGYGGELHPEVALELGFGGETPIFWELDLARLLSVKSTAKIEGAQFYTFPPVTRDIALLVARTTTHAQIDAALRSFKRRNLTESRLFDAYEGEHVSPEQKSMAYGLTFRSLEKTLNEQEVEAELTALLTHLKTECGATLR